MPACSVCGANISDDDRFCSKCGAKTSSDTIMCSKCGQRLEADSKFCRKCGNPVNQQGDKPIESNHSNISANEANTHFVQAKCTNCAAHLEVDCSKEAAICPYCGTPYIVEKAIKNYYVSNNITAGVVNIIGDTASDFEIVGGVLKKYKGSSTEVKIPDTVTIIGDSAFCECSGITSVFIPDSVVQIKNEAFKGCSNLQKVNLPSSLKEIGQEAFAFCSNLQDVVLPDSLDNISNNAFNCCYKLSSIRIPDTNINIDYCAFANCPNLRIAWPASWVNKELRRLIIVSYAVGYYVPSFPQGIPGTYVLLFGTQTYNTQGSACTHLLLYDKKEFLLQKISSEYEQLTTDLQSKNTILLDLFNRARISKKRIETITIPRYVRVYNKRIYNCVPKQRGTVKVLQITIVYE